MSRIKRPKAGPYTWRDPDGTETHGIGIMRGTILGVFLKSPADARNLADQLHDHADGMEQALTGGHE